MLSFALWCCWDTYGRLSFVIFVVCPTPSLAAVDNSARESFVCGSLCDRALDGALLKMLRATIIMERLVINPLYTPGTAQ